MSISLIDFLFEDNSPYTKPKKNTGILLPKTIWVVFLKYIKDRNDTNNEIIMANLRLVLYKE